MYIHVYRFDSDLNAAKSDCIEEKQLKDKVEREKNMLTIEHTALQEKYKVHFTQYIHCVSN